MSEAELITGNDEICQLIGFKSTKAYVYEVPNLFPYDLDEGNDTGWTEWDVQAIGFEKDWNMLVGAYNRALTILHKLSDTQKELLNQDKGFFAKFGVKHIFGVSDVNGQINITSSWLKLVDFCKWYNNIKHITKL